MFPVRILPVLAGSLLLIFGLSGPALANGGAANGGVLIQASVCSASSIDCAYDTSDDSVWVADQFSGNVCNYSVSAVPPAFGAGPVVAHPFGPAVIPNIFPRVTGLAYNPVADTLYVLGQPTAVSPLTVTEMNKVTGAQISSFTLTPPNADASVIGLTYDTLTNTLWYYDTANEIVVNCSLAGATINSFPVPQTVAGEDLRGLGITYFASGATGYLEVTYGNTLDFAPVCTLRLDMLGNNVGVEVNLTQVPNQVVGIARPPSETALYAVTTNELFQLDAQQPGLLPPNLVTCFSNLDGSVTLNWENNGPGAGGAYQVIQISRAPNVSITLGGGVTSYNDLTVPQDTVVDYTITVFQGPDQIDATCQARTGRGALVDYVPFDGGRPFDLAHDEVGNRLFVTDSINNEILVYDSITLTLIDVLTAGGTLVNPTGIAYNPTLADGFTLVVAQGPLSALLTRINPDDDTVAPATFPPGGSSSVSGMTYDFDNDWYVFTDPDLLEVRTIEADVNQGPGTLIASCSTAPGAGFDFANGVAYVGLNEILATINSGGVNAGAQKFAEGNINCLQTVPLFSVTTEEIGGSQTEIDGVLGIEGGGNVMFVAGGASNTIFRVLLAGGGTVFIRGDANGTNNVPDLADVLFIANYLFGNGPTPECLDAADANDDGTIDISDSLYLIIHLFLSGPQPPAPYPAPGVDPTFLDGLSC